MDRRPRGGGDDADAVGIGGQGLLVGQLEQALLHEPILHLLEGHLQVSGPVGDQAGAVELIGPVPGIDRDPAHGEDRHAVLGLEAQGPGAALEQDALQGALGVLQRKVVMARGIELVVADLDVKLPNGNNKVHSVFLGNMADDIYKQLTKDGVHTMIPEEDNG